MPGHEARLKDAAAPLADYLDEVSTEIEKLEKLLTELRDYKRRLTTVVRQLDPERVPVAQTNGKKKPSTTVVTQVSEEKIQQVLTYLQSIRAIVNERGIWTAELMVHSKSPDTSLPEMSEASMRAAVAALYERGALVLDRVETGGRKVYKVLA